MLFDGIQRPGDDVLYFAEKLNAQVEAHLEENNLLCPKVMSVLLTLQRSEDARKFNASLKSTEVGLLWSESMIKVAAGQLFKDAKLLHDMVQKVELWWTKLKSQWPQIPCCRNTMCAIQALFSPCPSGEETPQARKMLADRATGILGQRVKFHPLAAPIPKVLQTALENCGQSEAATA